MATAVEYGLIAALIGVSIITAVGLVGNGLNETFNATSNENQQAPPEVIHRTAYLMPARPSVPHMELRGSRPAASINVCDVGRAKAYGSLRGRENTLVVGCDTTPVPRTSQMVVLSESGDARNSGACSRLWPNQDRLVLPVEGGGFTCVPQTTN